MTTDYDWPALPGGDVLMQLREAQAALSRVRALAKYFEERGRVNGAAYFGSEVGVKIRAAVGGAS